MKITSWMFETAALGPLLAVCAGGPSMALGDYGSGGEDVGGVGGHEWHEGGLAAGHRSLTRAAAAASMARI